MRSSFTAFITFERIKECFFIVAANTSLKHRRRSQKSRPFYSCVLRVAFKEKRGWN